MRALLGLCMSLGALAGEGDFFRPLVTASYGHDSNIFRFADDAEAASSGIDTKIRGVNYYDLGVGFLLDWRQSRQRLQARAVAHRVKYGRYGSLLDYDGEDLLARWDWQLGNRWRGQLDASRSKTLGSFNNTTAGGGNVRTENRANLRATYDIHSNWLTEVRYNHIAQRLEAQTVSDYDINILTAGAYYRGGTLERLGAELRYHDLRRPNPAPGIADASELGLGMVADWTPSGKTRLRGRLGYVNRDEAGTSSQDFSGLEARVDADYAPSGKLLVNGSLYRGVDTTDLLNADYLVRTGASVSAQWSVLPKTRLGAFLTVEEQDYQGVSSAEDLVNMGVNATYTPWAGGDLSVAVQRASRDSEDALRDFDSTQLLLRASLAF